MDDFDDFFDSPRGKSVVHKSTNKVVHEKPVQLDQPVCDIQIPSTNAKPPAHPNSRPTSGASRRTVEVIDQYDDRTPKCVIEAKVPIPDDNDYDYSSDEFDINESESDSGRITPTPRHPVTGTRRPIHQNLMENTDIKLSSTRNRQDLNTVSDEDSDNCSEVTDVSPMSSPLHTPHSKYEKRLPSQGIQSKSTSSYKTFVKNDQHGSKISSSSVCRPDSDTIDLDVLLKTVLDMESKGVPPAGSRQHFNSVRPQSAQPGGKARRNYSFSDDQIRAIDRENERLMKKIIKHATEAKKAKNQSVRTRGSTSVQKKPSSSAINRAKQLQKIESDNLMLLSRLQQTRPSRELRRDTLVDEFERRSSASSCSFSRPTSAVPVSRPNSVATRPVPAHQRTSILSNQSGYKHRPTRSSSTNGRYQSTEDPHSRPATVFAARPDDDEVLTWEDGF